MKVKWQQRYSTGVFQRKILCFSKKEMKSMIFNDYVLGLSLELSLRIM